ncbi:MAG: hypothetical protein HC809_16040 [Gammaproteobacteria bacterium]|nr:hypothetical protein [Gammaproteobacteria bacterium]
MPLWSDNADKERWLALPPGGRIRVAEDGDWELPIGSVLVKHFRLGARLVETRLFMRHDDGDWGGYSYEWDEVESDATLLPGAKLNDSRASGPGFSPAAASACSVTLRPPDDRSA